MSLTCIQCGRYVNDGEARYNGAAARALIPFAGRLMSDGPFCSKGCQRTYTNNATDDKAAKQNRKEAIALGVSPGNGYDAGDLKEQRKILELQKEGREAEETRIRQEKEAEEIRIRQGKAAGLREEGHRTRAFLLHNQNAMLGAGFGWLALTFMLTILADTHWIWAVSGVVFCGVAGMLVRNIVRESAATKTNR